MISSTLRLVIIIICSYQEKKYHRSGISGISVPSYHFYHSSCTQIVLLKYHP